MGIIAIKLDTNGKNNGQLKTEILNRVDIMFNRELIKRVVAAITNPSPETKAAYLAALYVQSVEKDEMIESYFAQVDRLVPEV